jgi:IS30 family transposase
MLSLEEDVEAQALRDQGWSISAIARHLGRDRKTIRGYLSGEREPGRRKRFAHMFEYRQQKGDAPDRGTGTQAQAGSTAGRAARG